MVYIDMGAVCCDFLFALVFGVGVGVDCHPLHTDYCMGEVASWFMTSYEKRIDIMNNWRDQGNQSSMMQHSEVMLADHKYQYADMIHLGVNLRDPRLNKCVKLLRKTILGMV